MRRRNLTINRTGRRLALAGRFDAHEIADAAGAFDGLAATGTDVELDLADVRFLDGAALGLLAERGRHMTESGGSLRITRASRAATIIMDLAHRAGMVTDFAPMAPASVGVAVAA